MRVVHAPSELASAHALAVQEAVNAFGDGEMMLERYISNPRHIEVQVAADAHGKVVCLFERECSMQRRNQKMIEEAPAPPVVSGLVNWSGLRTAASAVVAKATYTSLGTVEFIVDPTTGDFFFLEVNARLQVEHPVTEAITGLDLVALQLAIAEGGRLSLAEPLMVGNRVAISGHAMEVRVLAVDPSNGFRPSTGKILTWSFPTRPGVRLDTGFEAGKVVSPYYDSLLAKVIAHGATREAAIAKLVATLEEFHVLGVSTNIGLLIELLTDPEFQAGRTHTGLLGEILEGRDADPIPGEVGALAELAGVGVRATDSRGPERQSSTPTWELNDRFRIGGLG
jgi:acetyl/propionyl-CoA carboxylase alpha subunit